MKQMFFTLALTGMLGFTCPSFVEAQGVVATYSTDKYHDYDGLVQVLSPTRNDWYRVTLFFTEKEVKYIIEGRSPQVGKVYYSGTANTDQWIVVVQKRLDTLYGKSNYTIHFGPNQLEGK